MLISEKFCLVSPDGSIIGSKAYNINFDDIETFLGTKDVYVIQCYLETLPKRFANHSMVVRQDCNQGIGSKEQVISFSEVNTIIRDAGITDLIIHGLVLVGPSDFFNDISISNGDHA